MAGSQSRNGSGAQALAQAASDPSVDSAAAVRRTLGGEKPGEGPAAKKGTPISILTYALVRVHLTTEHSTLHVLYSDISTSGSGG